MQMRDLLGAFFADDLLVDLRSADGQPAGDGVTIETRIVVR
jgi:hypothetical protein